MKPDRVPERLQTVRSELKRVLREGSFTARDLSARVGISEKDVAQHLEHVGRSVRDIGERLTVEHPRCLGRERLTRPSRCPRCKAERVAPARFGIVSARPGMM
jgi:transcriptional regulator